MNSATIVQKLWNCCNALRDDLFDHDRHTLERPGAGQGTIGLIFGKAQNKFENPAKLRRLVDLVDHENESVMGVALGEA
jgi:type I restriction enzyme M protein